MKVPGIVGSFHQRTIKDPKTGRVKGKYWYHYVYDPISKQMQSERKDPPSGGLSSEVDNELSIPSTVDNELTMEQGAPPIDSRPTPLQEDPSSRHKLLDLIQRCLIGKVKHQRPTGWVLDEFLPLDSTITLEDLKGMKGYEKRLAKLIAKRLADATEE